MHKNAMREERRKLQRLLDNYESGKVRSFDEDETGQLRRDTTAEQAERIRHRVAELDRKIAEEWRNA